MRITASLETRLNPGIRVIGCLCSVAPTMKDMAYVWVAWTAVGFPHRQVSGPRPGNHGYRDISFIPGFN